MSAAPTAVVTTTAEGGATEGAEATTGAEATVVAAAIGMGRASEAVGEGEGEEEEVEGRATGAATTEATDRATRAGPIMTMTYLPTRLEETSSKHPTRWAWCWHLQLSSHARSQPSFSPKPILGTYVSIFAIYKEVY